MHDELTTIYASRASAVLYNIIVSIDEDKKYLIPANICPVVPLTFRKACREIYLVDIDKHDHAMDKDRCLSLIKASPESYSGIVYSRPYGALGDDDAFFEDIKEISPNLVIVDDRCLCRPIFNRENISKFADVTLYSTGYSKYVDIGFGGFAFIGPHIRYCENRERYSEGELNRLEKGYKESVRNNTPFSGGYGPWLDLSKPPVLWDEYKRKVELSRDNADSIKAKINNIYKTHIPDDVQMPAMYQNWRFNIMIKEPDRFIEEVFENGLFASRHYASVGMIFDRGSFPVAESIHKRIVNLFNDRYFDEESARMLTCILGKHLSLYQ